MTTGMLSPERPHPRFRCGFPIELGADRSIK
jgi:hypothetical protein